MKTIKCKTFKSCERVPSGLSMNKCKPSYCIPYYSSKNNYTSKNWGYCNMKNWKHISKKKYKKYKSMCKDESKCKIIKTRKQKNCVDALVLHNKMPYIWRFLKPNTRKHMIELANKNVKEINIPFSLFNHKVKGISRNITKKNNKRLINLRKKYKNI